MEGKTSSQVVRDLIEDYVKRRDVGSYIDALWDRIGRGLRAKGNGPSDVAETIREVRRTSRAK